MSRIYFFKNFLKDGMIASVIPSSSFSVKKLCRNIDFNKDNIIVEYGPGTGVFTKFLLKKMTPQSKLIVIEANKNFVDFLEKIEDPRLSVIHDKAENVVEILEQYNVLSADYVISGIPFSYFDKELKLKIIKNTHQSLSEGGKFLVYQNSNHVKKYLNHYFGTIDSDIEILNIPFLFIHKAIKSS